MDLSFSSMFFHDCTLEQIAAVPSHTGSDTLEFWLETPDFWLKGLNEDHLASALNNHTINVPISIHAPVLDLNPCSVNPDVVRISIEWIIRSIEMADRFNAAVCTIHPGRRTAKRPPSITDYRRLGYMLDCIEPVALSSKVKVAIENMEPQINALLTIPDELCSILDDRSWLWCTIDACHAWRGGHEILREFIDQCEGRIANVHLSGSDGGLMHQPVINDRWAKRALTLLSDCAYDGLITLEINDLVLGTPLEYKEKIDLIQHDIEFIRSSLG